MQAALGRRFLQTIAMSAIAQGIVRSSRPSPRVGIVGAGISGLLCGQRLLELTPGADITVFEWGRGPGGRTARRRVTLSDGTEVSFDHAMPFFDATSARFQALLASWEASSLAAKWPEAGADAWVGVPSNHAIARTIASDLEAAGASMRFGHHVLSAEATTSAASKWIVRSKSRATGEVVTDSFDALVLSDKLLLLPNPYAILPESEWGALALPAHLASTGAVVLLLALSPLNPRLPTPGVVRCTADEHPFVRLVVHDSAKPGRDGSSGAAADLYVVHSSAEYSEAHLVGETLDDEAAVMAEMQAAALEIILGCSGGGASGFGAELPVVLHSSVMAWDHAQPSATSRVRRDAPYLLDTLRQAGVCGDFFAAHAGEAADDEGVSPSGVEAAALSGLALADQMALLLASPSESP